MNAINDLQTLLPWGDGVSVRTSRGQRLLRKAEPTPSFWGVWRTSKDALRNAGISVGKDKSGNWEVCWWQEISTQARKEPCYALTTKPSEGMPSSEGSIFEDTEKIFGRKAKGEPTSMTPVAPVGLPPGIILSSEQLAIHNWFANGTENGEVIARAGTGKTFTITYGFVLAKEQEIYYLVYNKKNELEAKEKIQDPRVTVRTVNAFGFRFCTSVWRGVKPDDAVEYDRVVAVCPNIPEDAAGPIGRLVGFAKNLFVGVPAVGELVRVANERGIFCPIQTPEGEDEFPVDRLAVIAQTAMQYALDVRDPQDRISFNDQVWLAVSKNWVRPIAELIACDEVQDLNLPQLVMIQRSVRKGGRVLAVGDDRQCIYTFRGAHPGGMKMMQETLKATVMGLTVTRRCPRLVVEMVKPIVPDFQAAPDAPEGEIFHCNEGELLERLQVGDAVLSRANAPLMPLCLALLRKGVPARIEGRDIGKRLVGMVRKQKAKSVPDFMRRVSSWLEKQRKRLDIGKEGKVRMAGAEDDAATLMALAEGCANVQEIESRILSLFQNTEEGAKPAVVLSSTHKAKGLEWSRTAVLTWTFRKSWKSQSEAQAREEQNLWYVALTRTKHTLTLVGEGGRNQLKEQGDGTKAGSV